jgi:hypothetical protein
MLFARAYDGARGLRLPDDDLAHGKQEGFQFFPDPQGDLFGRRIRHQIVERGVIEPLDDRRFDDRRDLIEVDDHALRRAGCLQRSVDGDLKPVRMPVKAAALPRVMREHVCGLEPELLANLHALHVRGQDTSRPRHGRGAWAPSSN